MGLFSGVATLLHLNIDSAKKEQIRGEIDLSDAVQAHINWKLRLQNYLNGKSDETLDPMVICRDDQCVLGKWIHGPALRHFEGDATFHQLCADHAEFHVFAGQVPCQTPTIRLTASRITGRSFAPASEQPSRSSGL